MTVTVDELVVADPADAWTAAGFSVDPDAVCRVGGVRVRLVGRDTRTGVVGWSLRGLPSGGVFDDLDGIPTTRSSAVAAAPAVHGNGSPRSITSYCCHLICIGRSTRWPQSVWNHAANAKANSAVGRSDRSSSGSGT